MTVDELRALAMFEKVDEDDLRDLIALGDEVSFVPGDELWTQSEPADCWWVLLEGSVDLVRTVGHEETRLGAMDAPGRWAGGFRAWDEHGVYLATGRATATGRVLRVPADALKGWTSAWNPFLAHLIEGVFRTARTVESMARQREALVALGTLAAGLAHELNNPAAAATRAVDALGEACDGVLSGLSDLAARSISSEQFLQLEALRREIGAGSRAAVDPMVLADREEALSDWLSEHAVEDDWLLAPPLAAAGAEVEWCERVADVLDGALEPGLSWVASTLTVTTLLSEVKESTHRISELVGAVKSYSQLDRASLQQTLVPEGLDSTVVMLGHRIPAGVEVVRDYDPATPRIEAIPGELNQVWTNLITNALDAMGEQGRLRLSTRPERDGVLVEIGDSGTWSAPGAEDRAFEPFFTTKEVGKGTGLGLDISRRIVVGRHRGDITIDLRPGETVLRVWLPGQHQAS
ncbi:cyclic nucleotide-binding domain-containing protein [Auraticoccus sp. F435]|uniref:histidine kinase n=1 Tax=Auraticoccus cholistanensis TaxID=2656650 RepID=A0A6A9URF5_9ACTN|nr:cyclic nucleotide-binding domain-containing protein [Auraticoccus cholistanensis]